MTEIDNKSLSFWHNLYKRWLVSATKIIKVDTFSDDTDISELLDIENEISTCINAFTTVGIELPKAMEDFKPFLERYNEICSELPNNVDKRITRPKNPKVAKQIQKLHIRYLVLKDKKGYTKKKCLEILAAEFPQWTVSTIETYLKK